MKPDVSDVLYLISAALMIWGIYEVYVPASWIAGGIMFGVAARFYGKSS